MDNLQNIIKGRNKLFHQDNDFMMQFWNEYIKSTIFIALWMKKIESHRQKLIQSYPESSAVDY